MIFGLRAQYFPTLSKKISEGLSKVNSACPGENFALYKKSEHVHVYLAKSSEKVTI